MSTVVVQGWKPGFRKVSHTKLLQSSLGMSLSQAKAVTDRVLVGEKVILTPSSSAAARELARELEELGAVAEVLNA
jgi:ribosomal protein L7/L12